MPMTNQTAYPVQTATERLITRSRATVAWETPARDGGSVEYGLAFTSPLRLEWFVAAVNREARIPDAEWERHGDAGLVLRVAV